MRSVRGDEMPEEISGIGARALDVAACRAWPGLHVLVIAAWPELGVETGCYHHDIAFRTLLFVYPSSKGSSTVAMLPCLEAHLTIGVVDSGCEIKWLPFSFSFS